MVSQIYPSELQRNKANTSDTKAAFLDLHLSIFNDIVSTKNCEYDQEISQSQTADNPVAQRGRAAQPSQDTRKTN